jgi:transposase-like protein
MSQQRLELRAVCLASVLSGQSLSSVAKRHKVNKGTLSRWLSQVRPPRRQYSDVDPDLLAERIVQLIDGHIEAIQKQIEAASDVGWVRRQTGGELAQLLKEEHGGLVRLLAGLRPASEVVPEGAVVELGAGQAAGDGDTVPADPA